MNRTPSRSRSGAGVRRPTVTDRPCSEQAIDNPAPEETRAPGHERRSPRDDKSFGGHVGHSSSASGCAVGPRGGRPAREGKAVDLRVVADVHGQVLAEIESADPRGVRLGQRQCPELGGEGGRIRISAGGGLGDQGRLGADANERAASRARDGPGTPARRVP